MYPPTPVHIEDVVKLLLQSLQARSDPELFATWASLQELNGRFGRRLGMGGLPRAQAGA